MKFKKDGKVFEDIGQALESAFQCNECCGWSVCKFGTEAMRSRSCSEFAARFPAEAARLMGYEVVEEGDKNCQTCGRLPDNPPCAYADDCYTPPTVPSSPPSHWVPKEANMDKQKPRICEVLGVEVGERFSFKDEDMVVWFEADGSYLRDCELGPVESCILKAINHPDYLLHLPRFTEEEVADARAIFRLFGPNSWTHIGKTEEGYPQLEDKDEESEIVVATIGINTDLFPSILPGQSVTLSDILGEKT